MRLFVTGVNGQLGHDCVNEAAKRGYDVTGSDITESYNGMSDSSAVCSADYVRLDITNRENVIAIIRQVTPDVIIHCAAWTAVDAAEDEENREKIFAINAGGTRNIAETARVADAKIIYISWYDFTKEIYRQAGLNTAVIPVTTAEYGLSKARRPFNSRLDKSKLAQAGFTPLPDWKDALSRYLVEIKR